MDRSAAEVEAANALVDLGTIDNDVLDATYALLDLKKISTDVLKKHLANLPEKIVQQNIDFLQTNGFLPPVVSMEGGEKRKKYDDLDEIYADTYTPSPRLPGKRNAPSSKLSENITTKADIKLYQDIKRQNLNQFQLKTEQERLKDLESYDTIPEYLKNLPICDHNSASIVMRQLFPASVIEKWEDTSERNKKRTCRQIYEISAPETQCNNVIETKIDDICYICGFILDETSVGLKRVCEHILPIIQAVFFLELYVSGREVTPAQRLEYDWAHNCCNAVKGDISFLQTRTVNYYPTYEFNEKNVRDILQKIIGIQQVKSGKFQGIEKIQAMVPDKQAWVEKQLVFIRDRKMKDIVKYIADKGDNGMALMIGYRNCSLDKNMKNDFLTLLRESRIGGKTIRRKNKSKNKTRKRTFSRKQITNAKK